MQQIIPHFQYHAKCISSKNLCCIKADGQAIHEISDYGELDKFYRVFGYTNEIAKSGIVPDEFIWDKYIKGAAAKYSVCYQMHIIEHLNEHSAKFRSLYGDQYENWMMAYLAEKTAVEDLCFSCRMKEFCSKCRANENRERIMFTDAQRKIVDNVIEKKRLNPLYQATQEENAVIDAVLQAQLEA